MNVSRMSGKQHDAGMIRVLSAEIEKLKTTGPTGFDVELIASEVADWVVNNYSAGITHECGASHIPVVRQTIFLQIYDRLRAVPASPSPVEAAGPMTAEYLKANRDLPMALQLVLQYSDEVWRLCQLGHLNSRSKLADITLDARAFLDDLSDKRAVPAPPIESTGTKEKPLTGLWRNNAETSEGKYLVTRRDGTVPEWPYFVIGAKDPAAPAALKAYANSAALRRMNPQYVSDVRALAVEFEDFRVNQGDGDPDRGRHRADDPVTIAKMRGAVPAPPADTATRNSEALDSFVAYCRANPSQRFWQALRNWSKFDFIIGENGVRGVETQRRRVDTFYIEGLEGMDVVKPPADTAPNDLKGLR